jgi:hypothetical protein
MSLRWSAGQENRRFFVDALERALKEPGKRGIKRRNNLAEDVLMRALQSADKLRKRIDGWMRREIERDENWIPTSDFIEVNAKNTAAIAAAIRELRAIKAAEKEAYKGLTQEQVDQVFVSQLVRISPRLSDEHWRALIEVKWGENVAEVMLANVPAVTCPERAS